MDYILVFALSLDTLFACIAYGTGRIKIPLLSKLVLALVGTGFFGISILCNRGLGAFLPAAVIRYIGFFILLFMGCISLFETLITRWLNHYLKHKNELTLSCFDFVFNIYIDKTCADLDKSKNLSPAEAFFLAIPLSVDSLVTGLSIGSSMEIALLSCSLVFGFFAASLGTYLGARLTDTRYDLSWISGVILILLAVFKIL
jgi:putative sporulation protein YtaF